MNQKYIEEKRRYPEGHYSEHIFDEVPSESKVLDVGCNYGGLGESLIKKKGCTVFGIDFFKKAVDVADKKLHKTKLVDLEEYGSPFDKEKFDVIIFADVLECIRFPSKTLDIYKKMLNKDGFIIASMPNIGNIHARLSHLAGKWDYEPSGLLDYHHLRFFTRKTSKELFESANLKTKIINSTPGFSFIFFRYFKPLQKIREILCKIYPPLFALQFIVVGRPVNTQDN